MNRHNVGPLETSHSRHLARIRAPLSFPPSLRHIHRMCFLSCVLVTPSSEAKLGCGLCNRWMQQVSGRYSFFFFLFFFPPSLLQRTGTTIYMRTTFQDKAPTSTSPSSFFSPSLFLFTTPTSIQQSATHITNAKKLPGMADTGRVPSFSARGFPFPLFSFYNFFLLLPPFSFTQVAP